MGAGQRVAGYVLEEQVGQGGMAIVYRAHDERLDRRVALKLLSPRLAADTSFRSRFIRESRAAAAVDHPNIIPVFDAGDAGGALFIAMRYVQGGDVRALLGDGQALRPAQAWSIVSQVASALDAAHAKGLIHRDVKPANMLLDPPGAATGPIGADNLAGGSRHVYLSDFGISKQTLSTNLTATGQFVGTLDYIAPEQIDGKSVDGRADQYSLGCAAFEMLCGSPPFRQQEALGLIGAHLSEVPPAVTERQPEIPAAVDQVLARAMTKDPQQRYVTCAEFAAELGVALGLLKRPPVGSGSRDTGPRGTELAGPARPVDGGDEPAPAAAASLAATAGPWQNPAAAGQAQSVIAPPGQPTRYPPPAGSPAAGHVPPPGITPPGGQQAPGHFPAGGQYPAGGTFPQSSGGYPAGGPVPYPWPQPQPGPSSRGRLPMVLATVVAIAVVAVAAAVILRLLSPASGRSPNEASSGPSAVVSGTPSAGSASGAAQRSGQSSNSPEAAQAAAVQAILNRSTSSRGLLSPAWQDIAYSCDSLSASQTQSDVSAIQTAASQRQGEYDDAQALDTSALPNGASLKSALVSLLSYSEQADSDYATWAQQEQGGCFPNSASSAYNAAGTADSGATEAKTQFADLWNQIAPRYGYATVDQSHL